MSEKTPEKPVPAARPPQTGTPDTTQVNSPQHSTRPIAAEDTRAVTAANDTRHLQPTTEKLPPAQRPAPIADPYAGLIPPPVASQQQARPPRPTRKRRKRRGGLLPPIWSILLMLLLVALLVAGIALLFTSAGANRRVSVSEPRILLTPLTVSGGVPQPGNPAGTLLATATIPPEFDSGVNNPPAFALQGPTLPPPQISPTPDVIEVGKTVRATTGVRVRQAAGTDQTVLFISNEGELFSVIGGPRDASGLTWWQVRAVDSANRAGWAAQSDGTQDLLIVVPAGENAP